MTTAPARSFRQYVWDAPTRLFHWAIVLLIPFSWWSAKTYHMDWHRYSGLAILGLVVFRILWGVVGAATARFGGFVKGPRAVVGYLRGAGREEEAPGHNPLGGWSVALMLLLLGTQVGSGLFAVDVDGIESGPLSAFVNFDQGRLASAIHGWAFTLLQIAIGVHIVAILFYLLVKRRNLAGAMVTGYRHMHADATAPALAPRWRLIAAALAAIVLVLFVANGLSSPFAL
ncbi:MAG TPA: cytochrome b/b6 domain-containing protein [Sphingobium sp.]|uniref:cytochrome b/b6 domain-containing protein n=1 Tax=Sphingobium sp. TaxID=1912891 RepID=UPI002ED1433F